MTARRITYSLVIDSSLMNSSIKRVEYSEASIGKPKRSLVYVLVLSACLLAVPAASAADDPNTSAAQLFEAQLAMALEGDADGQYRVGEMHEKGIGTPRDPAKAYLWFTKAAKQGHRQAREKLTALDEMNKADSAAEQVRVETTMRALQRQAEQEAATQRAKEKAAVDTRARQQAEQAAARAKSAEAAARPKALASPPAPSTPPPLLAPIPVAPKPSTPSAQPLAPAKPAAVSDKDQTEFSTNPCKGPQAKFLSTCNK